MKPIYPFIQIKKEVLNDLQRKNPEWQDAHTEVEFQIFKLLRNQLSGAITYQDIRYCVDELTAALNYYGW